MRTLKVIAPNLLLLTTFGCAHRGQSLPIVSENPVLAAPGQVLPNQAGYWERNYRIPFTYRSHSVRVSAKDPGRVSAKLAVFLRKNGCVLIDGPARDGAPSVSGIKTSLWLAPRSSAENLARALMRFATPQGLESLDWEETRASSNLPNPAELYLKRDLLDAERRRMGDFARRVPGIMNLLQAQEEAMADLVARHEAARRFSRILVAVSEEGASLVPRLMQPDWGYDVRNVSTDPGEAAPGRAFPLAPGFAVSDWRRINYGAPCGASNEFIHATILVHDSIRAQRELVRIADELKAVQPLPTCRPTGFTFGGRTEVDGGLDMWVGLDAVPNAEISLRRLGEVAVWGIPPKRPWTALDETIPVRYSILKKEVDGTQAGLPAFPGILGLARAEIARLEPYARAYDATAGKRLIHVVLIQRSSKDGKDP